MQSLVWIIDRLDHNGMKHPIARPHTLDFLGKVGLNLAFGLVASC